MFYLAILAAVLLGAFSVLRFIFNYWTRLGFPSIANNIPLGCLGPVIRQHQGMGALVRDLHLTAKDPVVGLYFLGRPALLVRDPELLKRVLITDFEHFTDRGLHYDEENDPVGAHLFAMPGQQWKDLRAKLTPTFSTGKLKFMFNTINDKSQECLKYLNKFTETQDEVEIKPLMVKLNMNIIASIFFGFELNVFEEPNHQFAKIGNTFLDPTIFRNNLVMFLFFLFPKLMRRLNIRFLSTEVTEYVLHLFQSVVETRKKEQSTEKRNDFIQTVLELMEEEDLNKNTIKLSVKKCAAQAFIFYIGGYETSATTASFCLYELCQNPNWMNTVRAEVDHLMKVQNNNISYEDLSELKIMEKCIKETLRKYPALPFITRECTKDYVIPGLDLTIPKETQIFISSFGLHMDPKHFENPEEFNPNRFDGGSADKPYYPVGDVVQLMFYWMLKDIFFAVGCRTTLLYWSPSWLCDDKNDFVQSYLPFQFRSS